MPSIIINVFSYGKCVHNTKNTQCSTNKSTSSCLNTQTRHICFFVFLNALSLMYHSEGEAVKNSKCLLNILCLSPMEAASDLVLRPSGLPLILQRHVNVFFSFKHPQSSHRNSMLRHWLQR